MSEIADRLYQWMAGEMSVLPFNKDSKEKIPLTVADLEFLVQGQGETLWMHVIKHVYSRKKVDKIRKNILLNRLRGTEVVDNIQKNDYVGTQLKSLCELRNVRRAIDQGRRAIDDLEEKCKELNSSHKLLEYKRQCLKSQSDDLERRILLLQMAEETIASKVKICQMSGKFFDRFQSDIAKDLNASQKVSFNDSRRSMLPICINGNDSELGSKAGCMNFIGKCTTMSNYMVEEKFKPMLTGKPSNSLHSVTFSLLSHSNLTSTSNNGMDCGALSKSDAKKMELRKYVSENMVQVQPQILHALLLSQTSKGIASLSGCHSENGFRDDLRFLGSKADIKVLKSELDKKFSNLYYETTHNMIISARERKMASKAEQTLKCLMAQVEMELKEIFTIQVAMVGKAYELVKVEAEIASLESSSSYIDEFIREKDSDLASHFSRLKELHEPNEVPLIRSIEMLKAFRESVQRIVVRNHSEFQMVLQDMKDSSFLRDLGSFYIESGLITQEIMPFTAYPLEYHVKTNVCGKLIPTFKLLSNSSSLQNILCLRANGNDDAFFELCIEASMGHLPCYSSEAILLAAFNSKLFPHKVIDEQSSKTDIDDLIIQSLLSINQDLSAKLNEKEEYLEENISQTNEIVKLQIKETNRILDEAEFLLVNWCENAVSMCVPKSIVYEGKSYHQWYLEFLAAKYKKMNS